MRALVLCGLALTLAGPALAAEPPPPGGIPDLTGARSLALSASIGVAAGNEGIYVNPAALAARKRYSIEAGAFVDRRGATNVDQFLGGSIVDSLSAPLTAAVAYQRSQDGLYEGNVWNLALAGPLAEKFYFGVSGKWLSVNGAQSLSVGTVDAGIFWQLSDWVSIGGAGYNLVPVGNEAVAPLGAGAGIAIGNDRSFQITADWRTDLDRAAEGKSTNRYAAGAEVLLGSMVPVRAGFERDETLDTRWWSVGAGVVAKNGVALDVGYRQSLTDSNARTLAASLKLFLLQ